MRRLAQHGVGRRELMLVLAAATVAAAIVVVFVVARRHHVLLGDAPEYDSEGRFISHGHWWWSALPYSIPHASAWKTPLYPAWVGVLYAVLGDHFARVELVQAVLCAPATVVLTWWLGRRLFGPMVGIAAAWVVALYPAVWQWHGLLYSESLAMPLALLVFIVVLGRQPTPRRAALAGALVGLNVLARPSSVLLLAGIAIAWFVAAGGRRGLVYTSITVGVAVIVVAPWTIRNAVVLHGFLPVSIQTAAGYGTFSAEAAHDPVYPYAFRVHTAAADPIFFHRPPLSDIELYRKLQHVQVEFIKKHPDSLYKAFFWNGLTRLWDVRRPSHVLNEPHFDGRSRAMTLVGLVMWWILLPLALVALWRMRGRREIVLAVLATALGASIVFTPDAGTRYRAPLEPLVAVLACAAVPWPASLRRRLSTPAAPAQS